MIGRSGIATKILFWFLVVALCPLASLTYFDYVAFSAALQKEAFAGLTAVAEAKAKRVDRYFYEKRNNVTTLASNPTIIRALERLAEEYEAGEAISERFFAIDRELRPYLTSYQERGGYENLYLISSTGNVLFSANQESDFGTNLKTGPYRQTQLAKSFASASALLSTDISDFEYYQPTDDIVAFFSAPVFKDKTLVGIVAFAVSRQEVYSVAQDYTGLGNTGETIIGRGEAASTKVMAPLRNSSRQTVTGLSAQPDNILSVPLQRACRGIRERGLTEDYRGVTTLYVTRYLPYPRLGMVVKIDQSEALAPLVRAKRAALTLFFVTVMAVIGLAILVSRSISNPVKALEEGTRIVGNGNFDYRVGTAAHDEIGHLSRTFDQMTKNLQAAIAARDLKASTLGAINRIYLLAFSSEGEIDVLRAGLGVAEELTGSGFGFVGLRDENGQLEVMAGVCPERTQSVSSKANHAKVYTSSEVFERVINEGQVIIENRMDEEPSIGSLSSHPVWKNFLGVPLLEGGQAIGLIGLANKPTDYTDDDRERMELLAATLLEVLLRKRAEVGLKRAYEILEHKVEERTAQLVAANKELEDFAYIVSHDLKAPLRGISQIAGWLGKDYGDRLDGQGHEFLELMSGRARRMESLIEGILKYSRATRGTEVRKPVDLNALVRQCVELLSPPANIRVEVQDNLPTVSGDPTRLQQIFQNLISNAIKFLDKPQGEVQVGSQIEDGHTVFFVKDNGPGIAERYHEKIFQIFQTLQARDTMESTGIGLTLVKKIVEQYGGKIWLKSSLGEGSTFYFTLPVVGESL